MSGFSIPVALTTERPAPPREVQLRAHAELSTGFNTPLMALYEACNGFLTEAGIMIYEATDLVGTFEVAQYAPGFVLFGDDSGGREFLLHATTPDSPVYASDLGDLDPAGFDIAADDMTTWVADLE